MLESVVASSFVVHDETIGIIKISTKYKINYFICLFLNSSTGVHKT